MRLIVRPLLLALFFLLVPAAAWAGGSDDPPPYTLDVMGLTLPDGAVFADGDHVNLRYTMVVDGETRSITHNAHFEAKCLTFDPMRNPECMGHPHLLADYVGDASVPWAVLLNDDSTAICIEWVQVDGYNEHYGEGEGQPPLCLTPEFPEEEPPVVVEPPVDPPVVVEPPVEPPTAPEPPVTPEEPVAPPVAPPTAPPAVVTPPSYPTSAPAAGVGS